MTDFNVIYNVLEDVYDNLMQVKFNEEDAKDILESAINNCLSAEERKDIKIKWEQERAEVQAEAMEYQNKLFDENENLDDDYINEMNDYFMKQGIKYDLTEEFLENCVISEVAGY